MAYSQVMAVIQVVVIKRPFDIVVVARGLAETSHWSEPKLVGGMISSDRSLELSFEAVAPHGPSSPVSTPIAISHSQPIPSKDLVKRVKIKAAKNEISVAVDDIWQWYEGRAEA